MKPENECTSGRSLQQYSPIKKEPEQSDSMVGCGSSNKIIISKAEGHKNYSKSYCSFEGSEKLVSTATSDEHEALNNDQLSSDDSSASLVFHRSMGNSLNDINDTETTNETKKDKERKRNKNDWKKVKTKILKNSGQSYTSRTGKTVEARKMGPPCKDKCLYSCSKKFTENFRSQLFKNYWELGSLQRQRDFLVSCIEPLVLKYRRISALEPRKTNCAFYLMNVDKKVRVCKTFLMNTLGIKERTVRTVIRAKASGTEMAPTDNRGRHSNRKKVPEEVLDSVRNHISSMSHIGSSHLGRDASRESTNGALSIAEMHRHYSAERSAANRPVANYDTYSRMFKSEFNIGPSPTEKSPSVT